MKKILIFIMLLLMMISSSFALNETNTTNQTIYILQENQPSTLNDFSTCDTNADIGFILIILAFIAFLFIVAFLSKQYIFGLLGSIALLFLSLSIFTCFLAFGIIMFISSITFALYFGTAQH